MKKNLSFLIVFVVLLLVVSLVSCDVENKVTTATTATTTTTTTTTTATTTNKVEEPVHIHEYSATVTPPTCTEQGYTTYTCECGENYVDDYVDAKGHSWSEWTTVKEPTETEEGLKERYCECGTKESEPIAKSESSETSQGLEYALNEDGKSYSVAGIGTCTDTDIIIPSTYQGLPVTGILWGALSWTSIESLYIPELIDYIGYDSFISCINLKNIEVSYNNAYYQSIDGNLYSKNGDILIRYAIGKNNESFIVPDTVTEISANAFYGCETLQRVVVSDSVTEIGDWAFMGCTRLADIKISENLTEIKNELFALCESLERIVIPNSVKKINYAAFRYCSSLKMVSMSNSISYIGYCAFYDCISLTSLFIPQSVEVIEDSAFYNCKSLTIYCELNTAPEGWVDGWNALDYDSFGNPYPYPPAKVFIPTIWGYTPGSSIQPEVSQGLEYQLNWDGMSYAVVGIGTCTDTNLVIPSEYNGLPVTDIGCSWNGLGGSNIVSVVIPDSVTYIDDFAFSGCLYLEKVVMSKNVTCIGSMAFLGCVSLKTITIPQGSTVGSRTFEGCESLEYIYVEEGNPWLESIDGNLYSADGKIMYQYAYGKTDTTFELPAGVTEIRHFAFSGAKALKHIVLNSELIQIGSGVFRDCDSLESITIPSSIMRIGDESEPIDALSNADWVFGRCENLTTINYSGTVEMWGQIQLEMVWDDSNHTIYCTDGEIAKDGTVTYYNTAIEELAYELNADGQSYSVVGIGTWTNPNVVIPDTYNGLPVTSIQSEAFSAVIIATYEPIDTFIVSVTIPETVTFIGDYAFYDCALLEKVNIPNSVKYIGLEAFSFCDKLIFNEDEYAYYLGNDNNPYHLLMRIKDVSITNYSVNPNTKCIHSFAFERCESLNSITIHTNITSIAAYGLDSTQLTSIIFEDIYGWERRPYGGFLESVAPADLANPDIVSQYFVRNSWYNFWKTE